jgi:hypothetical protein
MQMNGSTVRVTMTQTFLICKPGNIVAKNKIIVFTERANRYSGTFYK